MESTPGNTQGTHVYTAVWICRTAVCLFVIVISHDRSLFQGPLQLSACIESECLSHCCMKGTTLWEIFFKNLKGQFTHEIKYFSAYLHLDCWVSELQSFGDLSSIIERYGARLLVPKASKKVTFEKTQQHCLFPKTMTQLLKLIHRPCCEQLHEGMILFPYHCGWKHASTHEQGRANVAVQQRRTPFSTFKSTQFRAGASASFVMNSDTGIK